MCSIWLVLNLFLTCSHQVPNDASMCGEYIHSWVIFHSKEIHYQKMQLELSLSPSPPSQPINMNRTYPRQRDMLHYDSMNTGIKGSL